MNDRLRAVAHRPRRLGCELEEPQQVALAPALALGSEADQVFICERHQVAARRIHLEDQHVADVLGQAVGEVARVQALLERAVERAQRARRIALEDRAGEGEERLAVGDAEHPSHQLLVHIGLAR